MQNSVKDYTAILPFLVFQDAHKPITSPEVINLLSLLRPKQWETLEDGIDTFGKIQVHRRYHHLRGDYLSFEYKDGYVVGAWASDKDGRVWDRTRYTVRQRVRHNRRNKERTIKRGRKSTYLAVNPSILEQLVNSVA